MAMLSSASLSSSLESSSLESSTGISLIFERGALGCSLGRGASSSYSSSSLLLLLLLLLSSVILNFPGLASLPASFSLTGALFVIFSNITLGIRTQGMGLANMLGGAEILEGVIGGSECIADSSQSAKRTT